MQKVQDTKAEEALTKIQSDLQAIARPGGVPVGAVLSRIEMQLYETCLNVRGSGTGLPTGCVEGDIFTTRR